MTAISTNKFFFKQRYPAFLLGFASILYIPLLGNIKLVDLFALLAVALYLRAPRKINKQTTLLLISVFSIIISTLATTMIEGYARPNLWAGMLGTILSIMSFIVISTYRQEELISFLRGVVISSLSVCILIIFEINIGISYYEASLGRFNIGTMPDPNRYAFSLACATAIVFSAPRLIFPKLPLLLSPFALVLLIYILFTTGSRSGLSITVGTLFFLMFSKLANPRYLKKAVKKSFLFPIGLGVITIPLLFSSLDAVKHVDLSNANIIRKFDNRSFSYTEDARFDKLLVGLAMFDENPVLGFGLDGYSNYSNSGTSHNSYLEILVAGGILAFIPFIIFIAVVLAQAFREALNRSISGITERVAQTKFTLALIIAIFMISLNINFLLFAYLMLGVISNTSYLPSISPRAMTNSYSLNRTLLSQGSL